jgi:hypothetical protein
MTATRMLGLLVTTIVALASVYLLREATESRHSRQDPDSRMQVVVDVHSRDRPREYSTADLGRSLVMTCRVEVAARVVDQQIDDLGGGRLRFVLQPSLDESDRRQLDGCLEDAEVDHVQADVLSMTELTPV